MAFCDPHGDRFKSNILIEFRDNTASEQAATTC